MFKTDGILKVAKVFSITGKYLWLSKRPGCDVNALKLGWAREISNHFKMDLKVSGEPYNLNESCILLGNHISYLDIPVLMHICPEITFVSKKEVKHWPVIGSAAVKMDTIFVERNNPQSRALAKETIATTLNEKKNKLVIFPSGTTSMGPSKRWHKGIFEIAQEHDILVQPFRIHYSPMRAAAYIDDDNLVTHMIGLLKLNKLHVRVEFHSPVKVSANELERWKEWSETPFLEFS